MHNYINIIHKIKSACSIISQSSCCFQENLAGCYWRSPPIVNEVHEINKWATSDVRKNTIIMPIASTFLGIDMH